MKLGSLIKEIDCIEVENFSDCDITNVFSDSREKFRNSLFIAVKGLTSDGAEFASDAIESGACAVIYETDIARKFPGVTYIKVKDARAIQSKVAGLVYSRPAEKLQLTGITGTNGKTSTAYIYRHILKHNKIKCGLLGTTEYDLGGRKFEPSRTTPDAVFLQRYFKEMRDSGLKHAVMEVSSHAISLKRIEDVYFDTAVFTNLTMDHLDFHGSMEDYSLTKSELFSSHLKKNGTSVINADDEYTDRILKASPFEVVTFSGIKKSADLFVSDVRYLSTGMEMDFTFKGAEHTLGTSLNGRFQAMNISAAVLAADRLGINITDIIGAFGKPLEIPGRLEKVYEGDFSVYVDYAHTPDALLRTLSTVREFCRGRLITVFGCGGNRDHEKRPVMGKIASELSDIVIVTDDNPRNEDPANIILEVTSGITGSNWTSVPGREEAVCEALSTARKDDVIVIAGKGHENYQEINGVKYPFSDRETILKFTGRKDG